MRLRRHSVAIDDRASYNASDRIISHCSIPWHLMLSEGQSVFSSVLTYISSIQSHALSACQMA